MSTPHIRLRPLRSTDESAVVAAQETMAVDGFQFALLFSPDLPWQQYLEKLARLDIGDVAEDFVPSSFLVADVDGDIVGRTSIRHTLNEWLSNRGGHIGYGVLPAHRRRGYATEILRQSLVIARARGVDQVLVTCDQTNEGSRATIERCGGYRDPDRPTFDHDGVLVSRYLID